MTVTAMPQPATEAATPAKAGGKKKKKLLVIVALVALLGGAGWWFVLRPAPSGPPKPGIVVTLDAIQVNLAGAHYLRMGLALQAVSGVKEVDGSKALDAAIDVFSGQTMAEVNAPKGRARLKAQLVKRLSELYDHDVMGVYFTEFVTQ